MKTAVQAGVVLGILIVVWCIAYAFTGWYKDPGMMWTFWMVIPFELILLVWMLKNTAKQGFGYGQQIGAGLVFSLVGGVIIFIGSWLVTSVLFPTYYPDMNQVYEKLLLAKGRSAADVETIMAQTRKMNTPIMGACMGFIGTVVTGFFGSLIGGAFFRRR